MVAIKRFILRMNMTGKYTINAVITITQNTRNCMVVLPEYFGERNITHAQFKYLTMYTGSTMQPGARIGATALPILVRRPKTESPMCWG